LLPGLPMARQEALTQRIGNTLVGGHGRRLLDTLCAARKNTSAISRYGEYPSQPRKVKKS
jgi:hypothetical protein